MQDLVEYRFLHGAIKVSISVLGSTISVITLATNGEMLNRSQVFPFGVKSNRGFLENI